MIRAANRRTAWLKPELRAHFRDIRLFKDMTVIDNVKVALNNSVAARCLSHSFACLLSGRREKGRQEERALELLDVLYCARTMIRGGQPPTVPSVG